MPKYGFKHPVSGEFYDPEDERLIGTGNPPHAPGPVGHGTIPMTPVLMTDAQAAAAKGKADQVRSGHRRRPATHPQFEH